ncbi:MAG: O-antigen ligase family protein [Solirubrobacteraceae bacterium]
MESVATHEATRRAPALRRIELDALCVWVLVGGLVLYLAIDGGGYDIVVHSQVSIVVWWLVLLGAAWGILPRTQPSRLAWTGIALFGGFVAWTALGATWSLSTERSLQSLSLVAGYLGILVLGIGLHRDRDRALRQTIGAVSAAIVVVAILALASRVRPDLFPASQVTGTFLKGSQSRLSWPLNYWNALGALMALGIPLLLSVATSARSLYGQAAAAAALPVVALCSYLTFSRGGALAAGVALVVFIALAPERIPKLLTALSAAIGSAVLIAAAVHRGAIEHGLNTALTRSQGNSLIVVIVLVCVGVALAQGGIGLAVRHGQPPRLFRISRRTARGGLAILLIAVAAAIVVLAASGKISHEWQQFKKPAPTTQLRTTSLSRYSAAGGEGRYDLWRVAVKSTSGHLLKGSGPGTYQLLWLPRAPFPAYVINAHSLYFETLAELGIVGAALLIGFLVLVAVGGVVAVVRSRYEARARAAGATAAILAFMVSVAFDWFWQVPVLPAVVMLLAAALLTPGLRGRLRRRSTPSGPRAWIMRGAAILVAIGCLAAIGIPLATVSGVRRSQAAAASGNYPAALTDARAAARVEPGAATPQLQLALVLEAQGLKRAALPAARAATRDEPQNWTGWLVLSRVEAENGNARASVAAYKQARLLNPRSAIFKP